MKLSKTALIFLVLAILSFVLGEDKAGSFLGTIAILLMLFEQSQVKSVTVTSFNSFKFDLCPQKPDIFNLITEAPEWIETNLDIHEIQVSQVPLYMALHLKYTLTLTSPFNFDKKVSVSTLNDFKKYISLGYYGYRTIDISRESEYRTLLVFFELLKKCKKATRFSSDTLDKIILEIKANELPDLLDCDMDDEMKEMHKNDTVREYLDTTEYEINLQDKYLTITKKDTKYNECKYWSFWEIQRADFSNSGCEEIFVLCHYKSAGTLNYYYPLLIRHIGGRYDTVDAIQCACDRIYLLGRFAYSVFSILEKFKDHARRAYAKICNHFKR